MAKERKQRMERTNIAGKMYHPNDYKSHSETSKGFAMTHEQVNDTLVEGTIDGVIEDVNGEDIPLKERE